jgi:hypothetical protein
MGDYTQGEGQYVPLQDYAPDLPSDTPGILLDCNNALPSTKGYKSRNAPAQVAPAVPGPIYGSYLAYYSDQSTSVLAATNSQIYRLVSGAWQASGIAYAATAGTRVRFTQFNDDVIAVAPGISPLVATGPTGTFAILPGTTGSPPSNASVVLSIAGTVVMFKGANWYNSAFGNDTTWTPDVQTLAATGTLYDYPGPIVAAAPIFRAMVVFKENAIWLGTFTGAPFVWNFQLISAETGTWGQECVVVLPDSIAFLGIDDFYVTTGYTPTRIPNNIRRWFFDNVNQQYLPLVTSWYDALNVTIFWHYCSKQAPNPPSCDRYVAYNLRMGKWATGYLEMNSVIGNTQPGAMNGYYFDDQKQLWSWTGAPGTMMLKTSYMGQPSRLTQLMRVRASFSEGTYPTSESLVPYHTYILGQPDGTGPDTVLGADDWFNFRQYDRYHRVQLNTVGPTTVQGFAYEYRVGGTR